MGSNQKHWLTLFIAVIAGCKGASLEGKTACRDQGDCLSGYACIDDECVATSEGCDAFCSNACSALSSCGIDGGESCTDDCIVDLGESDCGRYEPLDRLSCGRLERAIECAGYCQAVCARGAECATIDAELCALGCVDDEPLLCNALSVAPRSCDHIKAETRLYDNAGRALVEGGSFAFGGYDNKAFGLCERGEECEAPLGCSSETNTCATCTSDAECGAISGVLACTPDGCVSAECVADDDCLGVCDVEAHECRDCREDSDCSSGVCDVPTQTCVECLSDADCDPRLLPACDTETKTCVICTQDAHCEGGVFGGLALPACDAANKTCEECTEDRHCTDPAQPVCNTALGFCEQCTGNEHCQDPDSSFCDQDFCSRCFSDEHCAHIEGAPHCDVLNGGCVP